MSIVLVGSTSGSITLQEPAIAGSTVLNLPATSGTLITTGSSGQVIPRAALPAGSVLQVVNTLSATGVATSSNTVWANTGLSATITPTSATSRIFIVVTLGDVGANSTPNGIQTRILRNGSVIGSPPSNQWCYLGSGGHNINSGAISYFDTPSSTSSLTYNIQFKGQGGTGTWDVMRDNTQGCITIMEIAA